MSLCNPFPTHTLDELTRVLMGAIEAKVDDPMKYVASVAFEVFVHEVTPWQRQWAKKHMYQALYDQQPPPKTKLSRHVASGKVYIVHGVGRHVTTLQPLVSYEDTRGMVWFRGLEEFDNKFLPAMPRKLDHGD